LNAVDVLFVDEASQLSLANIIAVSQAAPRVVLLGDPQQLNQPTQGSHPEGTDVSALDHVLNGEQTIAPDRGLFIEETWRLHPSICAFTSELFYENRLRSRSGLELQEVHSNGRVAGAGLRFLPVSHEGNQSSCPEEANAVRDLVREVPAFEAQVRAVLARGLARPAIRAAFLTPEGTKALLCWMLIGSTNLLFVALTWLAWLASLFLPASLRPRWQTENWHLPFRRFASRTTIFRRAVDDALFQGKGLRDLQRRRPLLIVNAAELRTGSAFYFTPNESGSWRLGRLARPDITLAHAVTASAAYPMFLPALDEELPFDKRDGARRAERVTLTDGGVYDNLGLAPLWPDRDGSISLNVEPVRSIRSYAAGRVTGCATTRRASS
jgi:hypothetical protein